MQIDTALPMPMRATTSWTEADDELLLAMMLAVPRPPTSKIAAALGRTESAVQTRASNRGFHAAPGPQLRRCTNTGPAVRPSSPPGSATASARPARATTT